MQEKVLTSKHSVRLEPTKLMLVGTRATYLATGDAGDVKSKLIRFGWIGLCLHHGIQIDGSHEVSCCASSSRAQQRACHRVARVSHTFVLQLGHIDPAVDA